MLIDKKIKKIYSNNEFDFYIYTPDLFHLYYRDGQDKYWPTHRKTLSHKLHMLLYLIAGGYSVLYMTKNDTVVAYLAYTSGGTFLEGSSKQDVFTIFITVYEKYRRKGYGKIIGDVFLHKSGISYDKAYKTIYESNIGSIKIAKACGFTKIKSVKKSGIFHKIVPDEHSDLFLYGVENK